MIYLQRIGHLGILSSRGFASNSGGDKKEIFRATCVLWHNRYHAWHHYGDHPVWKRTRGTPSEAIRSSKFCNQCFFVRDRSRVVFFVRDRIRVLFFFRNRIRVFDLIICFESCQILLKKLNTFLNDCCWIRRSLLHGLIITLKSYNFIWSSLLVTYKSSFQAEIYASLCRQFSWKYLDAIYLDAIWLLSTYAVNFNLYDKSVARKKIP